MINNRPSYSFRDPAGQVIQLDGRVLRLITSTATADTELFLQSTVATNFFESRQLVQTAKQPLLDVLAFLHERRIETTENAMSGMALEHERIPFVSYPSEWPPEMLHAAGKLTLEIAEKCLVEGFGLKDATPYNVLFRGTEAVFIDILSFERRNSYDPNWLAYAQFVRTFLLPLFVNNHFGLSLDKFFLSRRDGIEPEKVYRMASPIRRLMPPFLHLVSIPVWLGRSHNEDDQSIYNAHLLKNPDKAAFILQSLLNRLKKRIDRLQPSSKQTSVWSGYLDNNNNYSDEHFRAKSSFVEKSLQSCKPYMVLDVGCNTGHFSAIAARTGARVVAIDYDPVVVGQVWRAARSEKLDILPLVVDLTRPTPALGWRNAETSSFLERATGTFDAVLMLAVIHHLLVSENIPLQEIAELASKLTTDVLIIEFIEPSDSMFKRLTRGRDGLYSFISKDLFETVFSQFFSICNINHLDNTSRYLYLMRKI